MALMNSNSLVILLALVVETDFSGLLRKKNAGPPEFLALIILTAFADEIPLRRLRTFQATEGQVCHKLAYVCGLILFRNAFFAGGRNIVGAGPLEDFFGALNFIAIFRVHRN